MSWGQLIGLAAGLLGCGYLLGSIAPLSFTTLGSRPKLEAARAEFLGEGFGPETVLDYGKLARVCLSAASENKSRSFVSSPMSVRASNRAVGQGAISGGYTKAQSKSKLPVDLINRGKRALDRIMTLVMDDGQWSKKSAQAAQRVLRGLPAEEVASFEALLLAAIEEGHLSVEPGAWVPEKFDDSGE